MRRIVCHAVVHRFRQEYDIGYREEYDVDGDSVAEARVPFVCSGENFPLREIKRSRKVSVEVCFFEVKGPRAEYDDGGPGP